MKSALVFLVSALALAAAQMTFSDGWEKRAHHYTHPKVIRSGGHTFHEAVSKEEKQGDEQKNAPTNTDESKCAEDYVARVREIHAAMMVTMTISARVRHVENQADCYLAAEGKEIEAMDEESKTSDYKREIIWRNVVMFALLHAACIYGWYLLFAGIASWKSFFWAFAVTIYSGNGVTAGAHRLWCHKAYKANFGVKVFLMLGQTISLQHDIIDWCRDHRVHHKWVDSDADPHNSKRGFFFSHVGWLMVKKHPKVTEMGKKVDLSDLTSDPVLAFQRRHYTILVLLSILMLTFVPVRFWDESVWNAFWVCAVCRLCTQLNFTWLINSAAHKYGYKPFEKDISSTDSWFWALWTNGEAWHNYHHAFPQDYRASEYMYSANLSSMLIDFFAHMGWVWDRKRMSKEAIERQKTLKGDHSRPLPAAHDY